MAFWGFTTASVVPGFAIYHYVPLYTLVPLVGIVAGTHKNLQVFWHVLIDQLIVLHSELITKKKIMQIGQEMSEIFTLEVLASNL